RVSPRDAHRAHPESARERAHEQLPPGRRAALRAGDRALARLRGAAAGLLSAARVPCDAIRLRVAGVNESTRRTGIVEHAERLQQAGRWTEAESMLRSAIHARTQDGALHRALAILLS